MDWNTILLKKFEQLWEWKKPEIERTIDEIVDGYLKGATTVTITKKLRLE